MKSVFLSAIISLLIANVAICKTLRSVLSENDIDLKNIDIADVDRNITSYAVLNNPKMFCIAYYLDNYLNFLENKLYVNLLEKEQNKWIQNELNVKTLIPDKPYFHPGSIVKVTYSKNYVYLITHKNPSAGYTLILSNELEFQGALYGRLLATFDNGTIVYHNSQVHFAPTHYAEISIYNPLTKVNRKIYPIKPYQKVRLEHIKKVKAAYDKLGEDWFRCHNHHMNPELFNNHLIGKVAIDNGTNSLAFTIAYDNKDYWSEEGKLKLRSFRELQSRFAKVGVKEPLSDYLFISLYEDLMRTKRFWKTQDTVLKLFEDDPELHRMLQDAFKSEREKGENWRKHFISLDSNWENPEFWKKISGKIAVPPEYTKVVYIYQNAHIDKGITYKEILLSYLKKRYGDIFISEYLEPKLLKEIFKNKVALHATRCLRFG